MHNGETVADIPVSALTDEAPLYERPMSRSPRVQSPKSKVQSPSQRPKSKAQRSEPQRRLTKTISFAKSRFKAVRLSAIRPHGQDQHCRAAGRGCCCCSNQRNPSRAGNDAGRQRTLLRCESREGAKLIVAEAARNVVCVGARPLAITNCLNFASPERPEVMWSFSEVIDGMAEACRAFNTPVVSGNVSFYNETEGRGILPTPVIGMIGLVEDVRRVVQPGFKEEGDI